MVNTKIVCTLGPATDSPETIRQMILSGMNIARLNFSHSTYQQHKHYISLVRETSAKLNMPVAILADLQGPKIRVGKFRQGIKSVPLNPGKTYILTTEPYQGDETKINVDYPQLHKYVEKNDIIYIDDGNIELKAVKVTGRNITCEIIIGGELSERKGVNIPHKFLPLPAVTAEDIKDLKFVMNLPVDFIAASFTRNKHGILKIRQILKNHGKQDKFSIISKIEDEEGIQNIDEIIDVSDGIMVARGDMGVSLPRAMVPIVQKELIRKCRSKSKPVIVATQMFESMISNPHPTRAEVNDVANSILDGADCVMLSAETSKGKYPVQTVREMRNVIETIENSYDYRKMIDSRDYYCNDSLLIHQLGIAIDDLSQAKDIKAIVCITKTGNTAKILSAYRPGVPIIASTVDRNIINRLIIYSGIIPVWMKYVSNVETHYRDIISRIKQLKLIKTGDKIIVTSGIKTKPFQANIQVMEV